MKTNQLNRCIVILHTKTTTNYGSFMMTISAINYLYSRYPCANYYIELESQEDEDRLRKELDIPIQISPIGSVPLYYGKFELLRYIRRIIGYRRQSKSIIELQPDLIVYLGGDDFSEYYNKHKVLIEAFWAWRFSRKSKVVFLCHSMGPFTSYRKIFIKWFLSKCTVVTRDNISKEHLCQDIGIKGVISSYDLAFFPLPYQNVKPKLEIFQLDKDSYITCVPSGLHSHYASSLEDYLYRWEQIIISLINNHDLRNKKIVLLAHVISKSKKADDVTIIRELFLRLKQNNKIDISRVYTITDGILASEARHILGHGFFSITGRMHAAVSTFQMGKPAIALSYSIKYAGVIGQALRRQDLIVEAASFVLWESGEILKCLEEKIEYVIKNYKKLCTEIICQVDNIKIELKSTLDSMIFPPNEPRVPSLQGFIDEDLCLSYGAVIYSDPDNNWQSVFNEQKGFFELKKKKPEIREHPDLIKSFLSYEFDYEEYTRYVFGDSANTPLGQVVNTYLTQSTNIERNYHSSSGGMVKETLFFLMKHNYINAFISIKSSGNCFYTPYKFIRIDDIDTIPQSIYHVTDTSKTIEILINSSPKDRFAIIGTPWQIDDMYLYVRKHQPELRERIVLTIGLITGWYFNYHSVKALCYNYNIDEDQLGNITYRGSGKKGLIRFYSKKNEIISEVDRFVLRSRSCTDLFYNLPMFLLYPNTQNMLADLVVGDPHLPECGFSRLGMNLSISRSKFADEIVHEMTRAGMINSIQINDNALERSQKRTRLYGDLAYSYSSYLNSIGKLAPIFNTPGKDYAMPYSEKQVSFIHRRLEYCKSLQQQNDYRKLFYLYIKSTIGNEIKDLFSMKHILSRFKIFLIKRFKKTKCMERFK